ncbi:hypothetical protein [Peptostreptococcus canis]|uniref:Uncharacterized protein n=1 Tax=Peptostreptococcus canis TaxID=1159213 RepID=A0ABR6TM18_9FIRM|nr:hypothetical protein [Peptostreptococcus canis]MBC2576439.1 hypothetical protein [Peptostreptococcus canis]MBP1998414.1 heme/copper-type cytochrome/quinol oxidase subunit 3 [Peptostreptococcus canis]
MFRTSKKNILIITIILVAIYCLIDFYAFPKIEEIKNLTHNFMFTQYFILLALKVVDLFLLGIALMRLLNIDIKVNISIRNVSLVITALYAVVMILYAFQNGNLSGSILNNRLLESLLKLINLNFIFGILYSGDKK